MAHYSKRCYWKHVTYCNTIREQASHRAAACTEKLPKFGWAVPEICTWTGTQHTGVGQSNDICNNSYYIYICQQQILDVTVWKSFASTLCTKMTYKKTIQHQYMSSYINHIVTLSRNILTNVGIISAVNVHLQNLPFSICATGACSRLSLAACNHDLDRTSGSRSCHLKCLQWLF